MVRCKSTYQNANMRGEEIGPLRRCTLPAGHDVLHVNLIPGRTTRWPDEAAHPSAYIEALRAAVADGHEPHPLYGVPREVVLTYVEVRA